ncbi:MAG TPA: SAM-dependent methyltransferase [Streptosporangiaceae bacterium]|nr:SAM-dependent methyltransferase [Streptosporangiaceae bacterium]
MTEFEPADPAPPGVDPTVASPARVWNYWVGGTDNFAVDRETGERVRDAMPFMPMLARYARRFLADAVRQLAVDHGVRQFLDIGTGMPTAGNTHQVAQEIAPGARVVYVDNDPSVLAQAGALLTSSPAGRTDYVDADLRDVDAVLAGARRTLDFSQPIAVLFIAVLHFIPDSDDPYRIVQRLLDAVPPGSFLVVGHAAGDIQADVVGPAMDLYNQRSAAPISLRPRDGVARFFDGLELIAPGVVPLDQWWGPGEVEPSAVGRLSGYAGVARKP